MSIEKYIEKFDKFTLDNDWAGEHYDQLKYLFRTSLEEYGREVEEETTTKLRRVIKNKTGKSFNVMFDGKDWVIVK